jgi:hypothetical protein
VKSGATTMLKLDGNIVLVMMSRLMMTGMHFNTASSLPFGGRA